MVFSNYSEFVVDLFDFLCSSSSRKRRRNSNSSRANINLLILSNFDASLIGYSGLHFAKENVKYSPLKERTFNCIALMHKTKACFKF